MPRFYFHTNHPTERDIQDDAGMDFPDVHTAKGQAVAYAGQLLSDAALRFWDTRDFELTVTDENGLIVFTMRVIGTEAPAIRNRSSDFKT